MPWVYLSTFVVLLLGATADNEILEELNAIDRELTELEADYQKARSEKARLEKEIAILSTELAGARIAFADAEQHFKNRIRALAKMPSGGRVAVLSGAESLKDFIFSKAMIRRMASYDKTLHQKYLKEKTKLEDKKQTLDARNQDIVQLMSKIAQRKLELTSKKDERRELLAYTTSSAEHAAQVAQEKSQAATNLSRVVQNMEGLNEQDFSFDDARNSLPWPTEGQVVARFGDQVEFAYGTVTRNNGVQVAAPTGTAVRSVAPGRVAFAGWLKGYGQLVILQHGSDYHTLYAHLAAINVQEGQAIGSQHTVGAVGDTGSLGDSGLYFEIRRLSRPVDPLDWLKAR